ncbi:MAG: hypothetical protein HY683_00795 [Chloroflexi bacterium]|nr:hypothetical protein [Chloroflexota bacterium]
MLRLSKVVRPWQQKVVLGLALGTMLAAFAITSVFASALMKADLHLVSGEDPSVAPWAPADGDAQLDDQGRVGVHLTNMDPARFPADGSCRVEVKVGALSWKDNVTLLPATDPRNTAGVPVTEVHTKQPGTVVVGDKAEVKVRCESMGQNGQRERHETRWAGTF